MSVTNFKQNREILALAIEGKTLLSIGEQYGISKARVGQILKSLNYNTREIKRENKEKFLNQLANSIKIDLEKGVTVEKIKEKYSLSEYEISALKEKGIKLLIIDREEIKIRRQKNFDLYQKGLTAHEIINMSDIKTINDVYTDIRIHCRENKIKIGKRINRKEQRMTFLKNKVRTLKKKRTFNEVFEILKEKGVTNANGGELRLETVIYNYYN